MTLAFVFLFLASGILNFVFSVAILREMALGGTKIGFFELRWQVHRHLKSYREQTLSRTGKVGFPYYGYWGTLGLMLASALLVLLSIGN